MKPLPFHKIPLSSLVVLIFLSLGVQTPAHSSSIQSSEIYAISNTGERIAINATAADLSKSAKTQEYSEGMMLPYIPEGLPIDTSDNLQNKIIGDDDRIAVADTTYFPWTTVVKISGNFGL